MKQGGDGEGEVGRAEERDALEEVVVPGVAAVEDGEGLGDVEVEPVVRRKGPEGKVEPVCEEREAHDRGAADDGGGREGGDG